MAHKKILFVPIILITTVFISAIGFYSYSYSEKPVHLRSAYWWKTTLKPEDSVSYYIQKFKLQKLYVRFFEVEYSEYFKKANPEATLEVTDKVSGVEIVPVVFINRDVLSYLKGDEAIAQLATNIVKKAGCNPALNKAELGPGRPFKELQIDCDWRDSAQKTYFSLLRAIKQQIGGMTLSVTLRLYPYKYREKCGVPPADRAALMMYNLGDLKDFANSHAIYSEKEATAYFGAAEKYPIPLDVALPSFGYARIFSKDSAFRYLENIEDVREIIEHAKRITENRYVYERSYNDGSWGFYKRHQIILDIAGTKEAQHAASLTKDYIAKDGSVIFFEMGSPVFKGMKNEEMDKIFSIYK
jgi:hypothetical protein